MVSVGQNSKMCSMPDEDGIERICVSPGDRCPCDTCNERRCATCVEHIPCEELID